MFLKFLLDIAPKYNITRIEIEQANTGCSIFAKKMGFTNNIGNNYIADLTNIENELRKRLKYN